MRREVKKRKPAPKKSDTSWGHVANWYHEHVSESGDTYHEKVIKPNLLRVLGDVKDKRILDVACGTGELERRILEVHPQQPMWGIDLTEEIDRKSVV